MDFPDELRYTREHEWVRIDKDKDVVTIGITDYAQDKLGDVVYVELPREGDEIEREEPFGSIESVKAVSDLFAPISGVILEINDALADSPEAVNEDPYGEAWLVRVNPSDPADLTELISVEEYKQFLASLEENEG